MKKILLFILSISSFSSFAKDGFFLQPMAGIGAGNAFVSTQSAAVGVGYQSGHWAISSGAGYMRTQAIAQLPLMFYCGIYMPETAIPQGKRYENNITLPLTVGYKIQAGKRFSFTPTVGGEVAYDLSGKTVWKASGEAPETEHNKGGNYTGYLLAQVNCGYTLNRKLSLIVAPQTAYEMNIGNIIKGTHNHIYSLNAGVRWRLSK